MLQQTPRPHLVRVRGGFKTVCPCGWTSETKRSQSDVLDRLDSHQDIRHHNGHWWAVKAAPDSQSGLSNPHPHPRTHGCCHS